MDNTTIQTLNRDVIDKIRTRIDSLLTMIGEGEYGLNLRLGKCSFNDKTATFQLHVRTLDDSGNEVDPLADAFKKYARQYGFEASDLGESFLYNGNQFTIVGLKKRNHRYPILVRKKHGGVYKFTPKLILAQLALKRGQPTNRKLTC